MLAAYILSLLPVEHQFCSRKQCTLFSKKKKKNHFPSCLAAKDGLAYFWLVKGEQKPTSWAFQKSYLFPSNKEAHSAVPGLSTSPFPSLTTWKADVLKQVQESFCKPENDKKPEQKVKDPGTVTQRSCCNPSHSDTTSTHLARGEKWAPTLQARVLGFLLHAARLNPQVKQESGLLKN